MTVSLGSHIILACFGVAFPAMIWVMHGRGLKGDAIALSMAKAVVQVFEVVDVAEEGGHAAGLGARPSLTEPVSDPQCPAVRTQRGATRVPLQPNDPPTRTFATYGNDPGGAG